MASETIPHRIPPPFTTKIHTAPYPAIDPSRPKLSMRDRSVLITGGGSGIGAAIARAFCRAGARHVGITGRTASKLDATKAALEALAGSLDVRTEVYTAVADVSDAAQTEAAVRGFAEAVGGRLDVLVSNAGYLPAPASLVGADADPEDFWAAFETNVRGPWLAVRAFLPLAARGAVVINVSAAGCMISPWPGLGPYAASKLAAGKMFEYMCAENPDVRVVSCHPGVVDTPMLKKFSILEPVHAEELPANVMVWLASPEADFLNGKLIWADWDVEELMARADEIQQGDTLTLGLHGLNYK